MKFNNYEIVMMVELLPFTQQTYNSSIRFHRYQFIISRNTLFKLVTDIRLILKINAEIWWNTVVFQQL